MLLDLTKGSAGYGDVLASCKKPTTKDISHGIRESMAAVISDAKVDLHEIEALAVGTTHFVNALVERNANALERVAVIRLCGKFTRGTPPFASFPLELRESKCLYDYDTILPFHLYHQFILATTLCHRRQRCD